jgi:hypothetical protein
MKNTNKEALPQKSLHFNADNQSPSCYHILFRARFISILLYQIQSYCPCYHFVPTTVTSDLAKVARLGDSIHHSSLEADNFDP